MENSTKLNRENIKSFNTLNNTLINTINSINIKVFVLDILDDEIILDYSEIVINYNDNRRDRFYNFFTIETIEESYRDNEIELRQSDDYRLTPRMSVNQIDVLIDKIAAKMISTVKEKNLHFEIDNEIDIEYFENNDIFFYKF